MEERGGGGEGGGDERQREGEIVGSRAVECTQRVGVIKGTFFLFHLFTCRAHVFSVTATR